MSLPREIPVVLAASAPWETPAPVNAHQIARRLAARGHEVLFVESTGLRAPALGSGNDWRRLAARVGGFVRGARTVAPRLRVVSPLAPPQAGPRSLRRAALAAMGRQVARAAKGAGLESPILWAFLPTASGWGTRLGARLTVYHCVDHYAANPGVDSAWIDALEAEMLRRADLVFATSPVLAERLAKSAGRSVEEVPNVADVDLFARALEPLPEPAELAGLARPRAVYVGNLAGYRVDFAALRAVADAGMALVLVGPAGLGDVASLAPEARSLLGRADVHVLGPRHQAELPALLRHCDVALIPFLSNDHTRASLPLKLWEYVAAGLPVVATDLPNLRATAAEADVRLAADAEAFGALALGAARDAAEGRPERSARARGHDWETRMDGLARAVAGALESSGPSPRVDAPGGPTPHPPGTGARAR